MKTPMQELIEWLDSKIESEPLDLFREPLEQVREKAESLLDKEKETSNTKEEIHPDSAYGQWMKRFNP